MFRLAAVLVLGLLGCGAPLEEQSCVEASVNCDNRCLSVCQYGEWVTIRCLSCGQSMIAAGTNTCTIHAEACVVSN